MKIKNEELIKKWEKLRLKAYLPTKNDVWTIGWGHTHKVSSTMTITEEQAEKFFDEDVAWVNRVIATHVKVPLNQNQYDAVASWVFNVGETNAAKSSLFRKLNSKDYSGAANEFPKWNKQKGKVLSGLVKRRAEEMAYFLNAEKEEAENATPDPIDSLKPMKSSKEAVGGLLMALVGSAAPLLVENKEALLWGLSGALVAFGLLFVINRVRARMRGER